MRLSLVRSAVATAAALACALAVTGAAWGSTYADVVGGDGPVSFWRLGEASGTTAADAIGPNPGSYKGGVTLAQPGAVGGDTAASLNGTSGYLTIPDSPSLHTGDNFTVELWLKPARLGANQGLVTKGGYLIALDNTNHVIFRKPNVGTITTSTTAIADTATFHHIAVTKAGPATHIYIDGQDRTGPVANRTITDTTQPLQFGTGNGYLTGTLDELALYPRALTPTQITNHYNAR